MTNNVILGSGSIVITAHTTSVKENWTKKIVSFTPPSNDTSTGPKTTKIVDLMRIERRFTVNGFIDSADIPNIRTLVKIGESKGGILQMVWDSETMNINIDKLDIDKKENENDEREIMFTCVVGESV
jgi:hypothetical protein